MMIMSIALCALVLLQNLVTFTLAMPAPSPAVVAPVVNKRTTPYFPDYPPSCFKCQAEFNGINSCADASAALADPQSIILNPSGFYELIKCSCTDTFQSAFPQCVDCFIQTNQTSVLDANAADLPSIVSGMREVCSLASVLLGGVASANSQVVSSTSSAPTASATSGSGRRVQVFGFSWLALVGIAGLTAGIVTGV